MLLEPGLAGGVVVGVLLNQISPRWLITALLLLTLGLSFARTSTAPGEEGREPCTHHELVEKEVRSSGSPEPRCTANASRV